MSSAVDFQIIFVMLLTAGLLVAFMREWALPDVIALIPENDLGKCRTVRVFEIIRDGLSVSDAPLDLLPLQAGDTSYCTPTGHQTNNFVFGAGGHKLYTFAHIGVPLNLVLFAAATVFIPHFWPFWPK